MAGDLDRYSSEDIKRLENVMADVKATTAMQEEIAKKVLALEEKSKKKRKLMWKFSKSVVQCPCKLNIC